MTAYVIAIRETPATYLEAIAEYSARNRACAAQWQAEHGINPAGGCMVARKPPRDPS